MSLGGTLKDSVGMDLRARCLLPDEYLMALNGDLRLRSSALPCPTTHIRGLQQSRVAGDHFGSPASGGFGCFVPPCHRTAAFDFIIAVAGQAVKQTTGRKDEAPRSRPPLPRSCGPVHELVTTEVSRSLSVHDRAAASRYTPPRIHLDACVNIYVPWVRVGPAEKIKILPLEEI